MELDRILSYFILFAGILLFLLALSIVDSNIAVIFVISTFIMFTGLIGLEQTSDGRN